MKAGFRLRHHLVPVPIEKAITLAEEIGTRVKMPKQVERMPGIPKGQSLIAVVCSQQNKHTTNVTGRENFDRFFHHLQAGIFEKAELFLVPEDRLVECLHEDKIWFTEKFKSKGVKR